MGPSGAPGCGEPQISAGDFRSLLHRFHGHLRSLPLTSLGPCTDTASSGSGQELLSHSSMFLREKNLYVERAETQAARLLDCARYYLAGTEEPSSSRCSANPPAEEAQIAGSCVQQSPALN